MASLGRGSFPQVRYLGGFSHALPFSDESFDAVFINAALHHMHDLPSALHEGIRVLKVGGYLITTGDPFRASSSTPADELKIFDQHTGVLGGINESVIRLSALIDAIKSISGIEFHAQLQVDHDPEGRMSGRYKVGAIEDMCRYSQCGGSFALRLRRLASAPLQRKKLSEPLVCPSVLNDWLTNQSFAMSELARFVPEEHVNAPFPGTNSKFQLLNGWRLIMAERVNALFPGRNCKFQLLNKWILRLFCDIGRCAYSRGRWFLRRNPAEQKMSFEIKSCAPAKFDVLINGGSVQQVEVGIRWKKICVDLRDIAADQTFALEISRQGNAESFDANCFSVRRRKFRS